MIDTVASLDPNIRWAKKTIRLVFMAWDYSSEVTVTVGGNVPALGSLECALGNFYEDLPENPHGQKRLVLTRADGETLIVDDEEERWSEDWLMEMLVEARVIAVEAKK